MLNLKKNNFLGEELSEKEKSFNFSKFHILPIPLEKTVSYGTGTSKAPEIIINASNQLERNHNSPCDFGIYTHDVFDCSLNPSSIFKLSSLSRRYVEDSLITSLPKPSCGIGFPVI